MNPFTESVVEEVALDWLAGLGYTVVLGPNIASEALGVDDSSVKVLCEHWTEAA